MSNDYQNTKANNQAVNKQSKDLSSMSKKNKFMIQKIKKQTQQVKQTKKTISTNTYSRLNQMKKLSESRMYEIQQKNYYDLFEIGKIQASSELNTSKKTFTIQAEQRKYNDVQRIKKDEVQPMTVSTSYKNKDFNSQNKHEKVNLQQDSKQNKTNSNEGFECDIPQKRKEEESNNINKRSQSSDNINRYSQKKFRKSEGLIKFRCRQNSSRQKKYSQNDLKYRYEQRLRQSKQRIFLSKVKLIQSQTNFKLQKKIKENLELISKQKLLNQIVFRRMQKQRQKQKNISRKRQQQRLVHQSKLMKIKVTKNFKKQCLRQQRKIVRSRSQQSILDMNFKRYLVQKQDLQKRQKLASKLQLLKNLYFSNVMQKVTNPQQRVMSASTISGIRPSESVKNMRKIQLNFKI